MILNIERGFLGPKKAFLKNGKKKTIKLIETPPIVLPIPHHQWSFL